MKLNLNQRNTAYDMSLFETDEVKNVRKDNILELPKNAANSRRKSNIISSLFIFLMVSFSISIVGIIIFNQVQLAEITDKTHKMTKKLEESYSEETQLQMKIKEKLSPAVVEDYAKNNLDMEKITPCQVEYFSLESGDKAEKTQKTDDSIISKILMLMGIR